MDRIISEEKVGKKYVRKRSRHNFENTIQSYAWRD
jgi:hypothetical protein